MLIFLTWYMHFAKTYLLQVTRFVQSAGRGYVFTQPIVYTSQMDNPSACIRYYNTTIHSFEHMVMFC